jgi:hypothetical protein
VDHAAGGDARERGAGRPGLDRRAARDQLPAAGAEGGPLAHPLVSLAPLELLVATLRGFLF